jgi:hypothetical protein
MPDLKRFAKPNKYFAGTVPSSVEAGGTSEPHYSQKSDPSNTNLTPSGDRSSLVKLLEEIKSDTVETVTNLTAQSLQNKEQLDWIKQELAEIRAALTDGKDEERTHYSTREFAEKLMTEGIKKFKGGVKGGKRRVRNWCREKRINAKRRPSGRGKNGEFMIPHSEFIRYKNEGLLPAPKD